MITMLTVVPTELATDLCEKRKVKSYNTLPQLHPAVLESVREFMTENVGYSDLPMACLNVNSKSRAESNVFEAIPTNHHESVLFQLDMPDDMIVSIDRGTLMDLSGEAYDCEDSPDDLEMIKDDLKEQLVVGEIPDVEEVISFIPFLEYSRCKLYAKFDKNFKPIELDLPGLEKIPLARLSAFVD